MSFGLDEFDPRPLSDEGVWYTLRSPRDAQPIIRDGKALRLRLAGPESERHRAMMVETTRRMNRARAAAGDGEVPLADQDRIFAEELAKIVLGWEGFREPDGTDAPCTPDRVIRLFTEYRWAREQVDDFASRRGNFLPVTGSASSPASADASEVS